MGETLAVITIPNFNARKFQVASGIFVNRVIVINTAQSFASRLTNSSTQKNTEIEKAMNSLTDTLLKDLNTKAKLSYPKAAALVNANVTFSVSTKSDSELILLGEGRATVIVPRVNPTGSVLPVNPVSGPATPIGFSSERASSSLLKIPNVTNPVNPSIKEQGPVPPSPPLNSMNPLVKPPGPPGPSAPSAPPAPPAPSGLPVSPASNLKGGSKRRTFLTKRLIKSSRKNRK
jgi:hypothetical protein